jgi:hypothetical protein
MPESTFVSRLARSPWFHLLGGPVLWLVHLLISYVWIEFACRTNLFVLESTLLGLNILSWSVLVFTLIVTFAALYGGWSAYGNWQRLMKQHQKNESTSWEIEARRFMSLGGIALSVLFSLTILLSGLPALALNPC